MTIIRLFFEALGIFTFACTVLLLGVGCVSEFRYWLAHRHDKRDEFGNYLDDLRTPGMGDPFDAPTSFREVPVTKPPTPLADEQPAVVETLDAARLRRSGS